MNPLLTIIIPTHNRGSLLDLNLRNLLKIIKNRNLSNIELIVSDNFSTDGTKNILSNLLTEYDFSFKIIQPTSPKRTAEEHIAEVYEFASGTYTWILSDDENILQDNFMEFLIELERYQEYDFYILDIILSHNNNLRLSYFNSVKLLKQPSCFLDVVKSYGLFSPLTIISSIVYRTSLAKKNQYSQLLKETSPIFSFLYFNILNLSNAIGKVFERPVFIHKTNLQDFGDYKEWFNYGVEQKKPTLDPWILGTLEKIDWLRSKSILDFDFFIDTLDVEIPLDPNNVLFVVPFIKRIEYMYNKNLILEYSTSQNNYSVEAKNKILSIIRNYAGTSDVQILLQGNKFDLNFDYRKNSFVNNFVCNYKEFHIYLIHKIYIAIPSNLNLLNILYDHRLFEDLSISNTNLAELKVLIDKNKFSDSKIYRNIQLEQDTLLLLSSGTLMWIIKVKKFWNIFKDKINILNSSSKNTN